MHINLWRPAPFQNPIQRPPHLTRHHPLPQALKIIHHLNARTPRDNRLLLQRPCFLPQPKGSLAFVNVDWFTHDDQLGGS
jgi:hypothetical protein